MICVIIVVNLYNLTYLGNSTNLLIMRDENPLINIISGYINNKYDVSLRGMSEGISTSTQR